MKSVLKWVARGAALLVLAYVLLFGGILIAMSQPPERFGQVMKHLPMPVVWGLLPGPKMWMWARKGTLTEGELAPDFTLPTLDRASRVTLSSHRGQRPVVLVFGSYT